MQRTTAQSQQEKSQNKSATCVILKTILEKTRALLMSLAYIQW